VELCGRASTAPVFVCLLHFFFRSYNVCCQPSLSLLSYQSKCALRIANYCMTTKKLSENEKQQPMQSPVPVIVVVLA
jgi:hypothetical protein